MHLICGLLERQMLRIHRMGSNSCLVIIETLRTMVARVWSIYEKSEWAWYPREGGTFSGENSLK